MNGIPLLEKSNRITWFLFGILVIIGVGFRIYGLENEMPWYDEIYSFHYNTENGLNKFLHQVLAKNPASSPLYFVLEFGWMKLLDDTPLTLRYLSILFSIGTMTFFFLFSRRLLGNTGGLIALSFMVCSSYQIFFAQEIRMYSLVLCLASLSCWAFQVHLHSKNNFWLMLNIIANALLLWVHLYGVFFIMAQGITYLLYQPRSIRRWFNWGVGHIPHGLIFYLWYITRNHIIMNAAVEWIQPANFNTYFRLLTWQQALLPVAWLQIQWGKKLLLFIVSIIILGLFISLVKKEHRHYHFNIIAQCLPLLLLPLLTVFIAEKFEQYMGVTRHFNFASITIYILLAWAMLRIPYSILRYTIISGILILYLFQAVTLDLPLRSDWKQAQLQLEIREEIGDVFLMDRMGSKVPFQYYMDSTPRDIRLIREKDQRRMQLIQLLRQGRRVWIFQMPGPPIHHDLPVKNELLLNKLRMDGNPTFLITLVAPTEKANVPIRMQPKRHQANPLGK